MRGRLATVGPMSNIILRRKALTRDTYERTVETVSIALKTKGKATSLLVYGSFLDDRLQPGVSDIDLVIYFWYDVVLPRDTLAELASELRERLLEVSFDAPLLLDASVIDDGLGRDGRFIPQNDNFAKVFDDDLGDSRLIHGKPFTSRIRPVSLVDPVEARLAYNLQAMRLHLLLGECQTNVLQRSGGQKTLHLLQHARSLPRKIVALLDPEAFAKIKDKKASLKRAEQLLPETDFTAFRKAEKLFQNATDVIDAVAAGNCTALLFDMLGGYESALKNIVESHPMRSKRKGANADHDRTR